MFLAKPVYENAYEAPSHFICTRNARNTKTVLYLVFKFIL